VVVSAVVRVTNIFTPPSVLLAVENKENAVIENSQLAILTITPEHGRLLARSRAPVSTQSRGWNAMPQGEHGESPIRASAYRDCGFGPCACPVGTLAPPGFAFMCKRARACRAPPLNHS
jgi:hypothetical protein